MSLRILYGGTFDPVHNGHLAVARAVAEAFGQTVDLVPSADPPHRSEPGASAEQRAAMLELAVAGDSRLGIDRRELLRDGRSYTVDTLRQVRAEIGAQAPLIWVLGADSIVQLHTWKNWRDLFAFAHVLAVERPELELDAQWLRVRAPEVHAEIAPRWREPRQLPLQPSGLFAPFPIHPLRWESASKVRQRIAANESWEDLVCAPVARYIRESKLYLPA